MDDPAASELLSWPEGLGFAELLEDSPQNLMLLVNAATPEEESGIGKELGIMGCCRPGLRVVGYNTERKER